MPTIEHLKDKIPYIGITILNGETESEIVELSTAIIGQIYIPNTFDGKELTFLISHDGTTFFSAKNINDNLLAISNISAPTTVLEGAYSMSSQDLNGVRFLKLKTDTSQTEDCEIILSPRLK